MKNACTKWKDQLLEAALADASGTELTDHLSRCPDCVAELRALRSRREKLDKLLPLIAEEQEPSTDFAARVVHVAAVEAKTASRAFNSWRASTWALAGAASVVAIAVIIGWALNRGNNLTQAELQNAQALAKWSAPSDVFLQTPGQNFLNAVPTLGESYFSMQGTGSKAMRLQRLKR